MRIQKKGERILVVGSALASKHPKLRAIPVAVHPSHSGCLFNINPPLIDQHISVSREKKKAKGWRKLGTKPFPKEQEGENTPRNSFFLPRGAGAELSTEPQTSSDLWGLQGWGESGPSRVAEDGDGGLEQEFQLGIHSHTTFNCFWLRPPCSHPKLDNTGIRIPEDLHARSWPGFPQVFLSLSGVENCQEFYGVVWRVLC